MTTAELRERLALYKEAERKILEAQSYEIGDRSLTRANLREVRIAIEEISSEIEMREKRNGRQKRVVFI